MGVTIHYRGRLRRPQDIEAITNELEDISRSAGWDYKLIDVAEPKEGDQPFRGININPHPDSESIKMFFRPDGVLGYPYSYEASDDDPIQLPWVFTKTQFAGADTHKAICRLFHYLADKWFEVFDVHDESKYYQTGEDTELKRQIRVIDAGIAAIADGLSAVPLEKGESLEERLIKILEGVKRSEVKRKGS